MSPTGGGAELWACFVTFFQARVCQGWIRSNTPFRSSLHLPSHVVIRPAVCVPGHRWRYGSGGIRWMAGGGNPSHGRRKEFRSSGQRTPTPKIPEIGHQHRRPPFATPNPFFFFESISEFHAEAIDWRYPLRWRFRWPRWCLQHRILQTGGLPHEPRAVPVRDKGELQTLEVELVVFGILAGVGTNQETPNLDCPGMKA